MLSYLQLFCCFVVSGFVGLHVVLSSIVLLFRSFWFCRTSCCPIFNCSAVSFLVFFLIVFDHQEKLLDVKIATVVFTLGHNGFRKERRYHAHSTYKFVTWQHLIISNS